MDIKEKIASDLDIPISLISEALVVARSYVKTIYIQKRTGGSRKIHQPSKKLKTIQYWLMANIFQGLPVHDAAAAYRNDQSILNNAVKHRNNRFFLKVDFVDFFPSLKWSDLDPLISEWHVKCRPDWAYDDSAKDLIRISCFYKEDRLPIGYPSSPIISNAIMYAVDLEILTKLSDVEKFGEITYTRYADDIVVSTNTEGASRLILEVVTEFIGKLCAPSLLINHSKTKVTSSTGGGASVTGIKVCSNGHLTIKRKQKDHIRLLLSLYKKGELDESEYSSLLGHLSFIRHVAPHFYTSLSKKYFIQIAELKVLQKQ